MNTKIFNSFLLAVCGILFCLILADINGNWRGYIVYNGTDIPLSYSFKTEGGKLTGTSQTPLGTTDIHDGKIEKDLITFKVNLNGVQSVQSGHIFADSINLKISYQDSTFFTTLKRNKN